MILGREHGYVFVEAPRTGSTAIAHELCAQYGGVSILNKHATYREFLRVATPEERGYFAFSGLRHPMDSYVSLFFKLKTSDEGGHTNPEAWRRGRGSQWGRDRVAWIRDHDVDFRTFFDTFARFPYLKTWVYDDFSLLAHDRMDFVIRFESIQEDFAEALRRLGLEAVRPLPMRNPTAGRSRDFLQYFSPEMRDRALFTFGPFMEKWGYAFPPEWALPRAPLPARLLFLVLAPARRIWKEYLKRPIRVFRSWRRGGDDLARS